MVVHRVEPERRTLHGHFSPDLPPILTIQSGDTVRYRTLESGWGLEPHTTNEQSNNVRHFEPRDPTLDAGHALCGPVAIAGAQPGMTLAVHIEAVRPGAWGTTVAGGWRHPVNERLGLAEQRGIFLNWTIDADAGTATDQYGHTVHTRPFMGVMGMPPAAPGVHPTPPPRVTGGNIDCKELLAGTTLFLPIAVAGGLFSVGDGHAAQGDGEASVTAIECPMDQVDLRFELLPDLRLHTPRARTAEGWLTFGFHEDLNEATMIALEAMVDLVSEQLNVERRIALALASVAVDLRITQIVNGVRGVHAVLPHDAIT